MASSLFASSGLRTSLQDIADACGIKPGSLYHHFDSKEAIVGELVRRYHAELDTIATVALRELKDTDPRLVPDKIVGLGIAQCAVRHTRTTPTGKAPTPRTTPRSTVSGNA
jgi:AcrR family transcriptional regulator